MKKPTPSELARKAVLRRYARAHDDWSVNHQMLVVSGDWAEAEGAHQMARTVLRAYVAEMDDPEPPAFVPCGLCAGVRFCDITAHLSRMRA